MKLQTLQREIEEHQPPATHGLMLGLWVADVVFAAEYWAVRAVQAGLGIFRFGRRHIAGVVVAGIYFTTAAVSYANWSTEAAVRTRFARLDAQALASAASMYRLETRKLPERLEDLVPHYAREVHLDPWSHPYKLLTGEGGVAVVSAGPDGEPATADDIVAVERIYDFRK